MIGIDMVLVSGLVIVVILFLLLNFVCVGYKYVAFAD